MRPLLRFMTKAVFCRKFLVLLSCLSVLLILSQAQAPRAFGAATYYEMTVHNNFGPGEFYGATPTDAQIWLLTDYELQYQESGVWNTLNLNSEQGNYDVVQLSKIDQGKVRIMRPNNGQRFYAILSDSKPATTQPSNTGAMPYNYFEWVFFGSAPQTFDLSWIDRWDFLTRMAFSNLPDQWRKYGVYGAKQGQSTAAVSAALKAYTTQPQFAWLGTEDGGFSNKNLSFTGATDPIGWITNNSNSGNGWAKGIGSLTRALDRIISTTTASDTPWQSGWKGTGPNWTTAGFRIGNIYGGMKDPATGTVEGAAAWTAYLSFKKDVGKYTMRLTDFTLYKYNVSSVGVQFWNAVDDAGGAVYEATEDQGMLDCIWASQWENLSGTWPTWVTNLGDARDNIMYAIYNAIFSGVIYTDKFVNNEALPITGVWAGYVPYILGVDTYNFEILVKGAQVTNDGQNNGLAGLLTGQEMITLQEDRQKAGDLVNPYYLELLRTQEVTPAYLYPSTDFWGFKGITGDPPVLGLQSGAIGPGDFGDNITLDWYLGGGGGQTQHHLYVSSDTENKCGGKLPCYTTVQAAVDAASSGSTLFIAGGDYSETVTVKGTKALTFNGNWGQTFKDQDGKTVFTKAPRVETGSSLTLQEVNITP